MVQKRWLLGGQRRKKKSIVQQKNGRSSGKNWVRQEKKGGFVTYQNAKKLIHWKGIMTWQEGVPNDEKHERTSDETT